MDLLAIRQARIVVFVNAEELDPFGRLDRKAFTSGLVERYGFLKYPQKLEDYDDTKGITFEGGRFKNINIETIQIYTNGILIDTRSSTDDCERVLEDALAWAVSVHGLKFTPDMVNRRGFVSEVTFSSEVSLNVINPKLKEFADRLTELVTKDFAICPRFETAGIGLHVDAFNTKFPIDGFRVERLANTPFADNKYYSLAPLRTQVHLALLEDFEAALKS